MPIEILDGVYHFRPERTLEAVNLSDLVENFKQSQALPRKHKVVRHNYLHDLESLWWIALYGLLTTVPTYALKTEDINKRLEYAVAFFRNQLECSVERRGLLTHEEELKELNLPSGYKPVLPFIQTAGVVLMQAYRRFEEELETYDSSKFARTHFDMQALFVQASSVATRSTTELPEWRMREIEPKVQRSKWKQDNKGEAEEVSGSKRRKVVVE